MMDKVIITVAPLAQSYYDNVESFPTPERLAQEICECHQAGALVVHLHALSVALGGNVRVGFEDSMVLAPDRKAVNHAELVAKARDLIEHLGRQVATPAETRERYGLPGR